MSSPSRLNRWPCYPDIPIILDAQDECRTPLIDGTSNHTLPVHHATPDGRSLQFIKVMSPIESDDQCLRVSVPEKDHRHFPNQPRRPTLRSFLPTESRYPSSVTDPSPQEPRWGRQPNIRNKTQRERSAAIVQFSLAGSQVPFSGISFQEKTVQIDPESGCKATFGLGIVNDPFGPTPSQSRSASHQRKDSTPNIAQRIEKRLWQYNSSGNMVKRWLLEIISWIIGAMCMAAIVGVLIYLKDERLPKWPLNITLNAYIAVLSKVASAALLLPVSEALGQLKWSWFQGESKKMWDFEIFDNASRGPWGAFLLLIRTKAKTLAALGAAVTLLALALDPFFQQVVSFPERWTLLPGNSSIPKVVRYEPNYAVQFTAGKKVIAVDADLAGVAQQFFYKNGTEPIPFGNGTRAEIPLSCPTSNCTWPPYQTLGVCSACSDVAPLLKFDCLTTTRLDWIANLTGPGTESTYPNGTVCGYFLDFNGTSTTRFLMSGYRVEPNGSAGEALLMRALPLIENPRRQPISGGSINFKTVRNPIADVVVASARNGLLSVYRNETPIAHECVLSWCVKTINSSYFWGSYEEEVVESFINTTAGPYPWVTIKTEIAGANKTDIFYPQNISINADSAGDNTFDYGVSNVTAFSTIGVFDEFFPSFLTVANITADPSLRFKLIQNAPASSRSLETNPWAPPNNVTQHIEKLALAMTNAIRSSSSRQWVNGTAYSNETYVAVQWAWLIFPLGILFLSLIFLVATIYKSSREKDQVGVWKTSALATLLYGLPDNLQTKITSLTTAGTPRSKAKELKIKLMPEKGWRISGNMLSPMTPKVKQDQASPGWI